MQYSWVVALAALVSCASDDFMVAQPEPQAVAPLAQAGTGTTVVAGSTVTLDASASRAADGGALHYYWKFVGKPVASTTAVADMQAVTTTVTLDAIGDYTLELAVTDDAQRRATSLVTFHVLAHVVTVSASTVGLVEWRKPVQLHATVASVAGLATSVSWTLQAPPGSTAVLSDPTSLDPTFAADFEGQYTATATVTGPDSSASNGLVVTVAAHRTLVPFAVTNAVWSEALQCALLTSYDGLFTSVHCFDPVDGDRDEYNAPVSFGPLALSPDGRHAALAHSNELLVVNLATMMVESTHPVPPDITHYAFRTPEQLVVWSETSVGTLDLATDAYVSGTSGAPGFGLVSPDRHALFLVSDRIARFDLQASPPVYVREHALARSIESGAVLRDGSILLDDASVLRTSTVAASDLTVRGSLPDLEPVVSVAQHPTTGEIVTVSYDPSASDPTGYLTRYDASSLARGERIELPRSSNLPIGDDKARPLLVAVSSDGTSAYVLARQIEGTGYFFVTVPR